MSVVLTSFGFWDLFLSCKIFLLSFSKICKFYIVLWCYVSHAFVYLQAIGDTYICKNNLRAATLVSFLILDGIPQ